MRRRHTGARRLAVLEETGGSQQLLDVTAKRRLRPERSKRVVRALDDLDSDSEPGKLGAKVPADGLIEVSEALVAIGVDRRDGRARSVKLFERPNQLVAVPHVGLAAAKRGDTS